MQIPADFKRLHLASRARQPFPQCPPPEFPGSVETSDLSQILDLALRRAGIILASVVAGLVLAAFVVLETSPRYTAKALLIVGDDQQSSETVDMSIDTQIAMLTSQALLESVLQSLWQEPQLRKGIPRLADLERHLKVMQELRSRMIGVTFTAKSPNVAADVANRVANLYVRRFETSQRSSDQAGSQNSGEITLLDQQMRSAQAALDRATKEEGPNAPSVAAIQKQINDLEQRIASTELDQNLAKLREEGRRQEEILSPQVRIYALATPPQLPSSVSPVLIFVPATLASMIFGIALALFLGRIDRTIYRFSDLAAIDDLPSLGCIPAIGSETKWLFVPDARSDVALALESLIARLLLLPTNSPKLILFASSRRSDANVNFALIFAHMASRVRDRVLLIDLDITRKKSMKLLSGQPGFLDLIAGEAAQDCVRHVPELHIDLLPIGGGMQDPLALLSRSSFPAALDRFRKIYDLIVINGPPVLESSEGMILAQEADQTMLVAKARVTNRQDVEDAAGALLNAIEFAARPGRLATVLLAAGTANAGRRRSVGTDWVSTPISDDNACESAGSKEAGPVPDDRMNGAIVHGARIDTKSGRGRHKGKRSDENGAVPRVPDDEVTPESVAIEGATIEDKMPEANPAMSDGEAPGNKKAPAI